MRAFDACTKAAELTSGMFGPIVGQVDAGHVAESARGLELASEHARRPMRRDRPDLHGAGCRTVHRLVHGYPSHGFVIDLEELVDLGLPARAPTAAEAAAVDALADALTTAGNDVEQIEPVGSSRSDEARLPTVVIGAEASHPVQPSARPEPDALACGP
jgi:hypothetical protein